MIVPILACPPYLFPFFLFSPSSSSPLQFPFNSQENIRSERWKEIHDALSTWDNEAHPQMMSGAGLWRLSEGDDGNEEEEDDTDKAVEESLSTDDDEGRAAAVTFAHNGGGGEKEEGGEVKSMGRKRRNTVRKVESIDP